MATRKRLTKALVLRICAVGLFLALGTFAVMHSIRNQADKSTLDVSKEDAENTEAKIAAPVPALDAGNDSKVAMVSATDELPSNSLTSARSGSPAVTPPPFNPTNGNAGFTALPQMGANVGDEGPSNAKSIPPFRPSGDTSPAESLAKSASSSGLPPFRPSSTPPSSPSSTYDNTTSPAPPLSPNNGFQSDQPAEKTAGSPSGGNTLLPPIRAGGSGENSEIPAASSSFSTHQQAAKPPGASPPFRPASASAGSNALSDQAGPAPLSPTASRSTGPPANLPTDTNASGIAGDSSKPPADAIPSSGFSPAPVIPAAAAAAMMNAPAAMRSSSAAQSQFEPPDSTSRSTTPPQSMADTESSSVPSYQAATPVTSGLTPVAPGSGISSNRSGYDTGAGMATRQAANTLTSSPLAANLPNHIISRPTPGERILEGVQIPALAVQKIAPPEIQVNREATFELIVKNTGRATADNVQVHDFVPDGTRLLETMPPAEANPNGQITWELGSLALGQQASIKMKILPQRPGSIGSVAHVTFGAVASAQTVCTQPLLSIRHEAPSEVLLGQNLVMTIYVENNGNGAAENVILQEDVPEGLIFANGQRELEYSIGTLPAGQTRRIQLPLQAAKVGQARNVLVAHGAGDLKATDTVDIRVIAPNLSLRSEGPNRKFLNRKATHTFSLTNAGTAAATNVQLVARLPRGLQFASANNQGQYDRNNHAVIWRLAKLDPQKTGSVELTTVPVATGQLDIELIAGADLNQRQQTTQPLSVEQLSELAFDIEDTADAIEVGNSTTFRVRVANEGRVPANNVAVQIEFPPALKPLSVQGGVRNQIRDQVVVLETIPAMQPGQEISLLVTANALQAGDHRTILSVRSDEREIAVSKEESTHVYADR